MTRWPLALAFLALPLAGASSSWTIEEGGEPASIGAPIGGYGSPGFLGLDCPVTDLRAATFVDEGARTNVTVDLFDLSARCSGESGRGQLFSYALHTMDAGGYHTAFVVTTVRTTNGMRVDHSWATSCREVPTLVCQARPSPAVASVEFASSRLHLSAPFALPSVTGVWLTSEMWACRESETFVSCRSGEVGHGDRMPDVGEARPAAGE